MPIEHESTEIASSETGCRVKALWKSRIASIFGIVRAGETDHREVASLAEQISADYHGRFLIELIQNASDQAARAQLTNGVITIVRTEHSIFVANPGLPFDDKGLRSITSLGLSTKDPQKEIGNKGIGFKSVFQVSVCPEIYTAPSSTESFLSNEALRFALSLAPFESGEYEQEARRLISELFGAYSGVDGTAALTPDSLFDEIKLAAPFKFPLPLDATHLEQRVRQSGVKLSGQTLVVLPLKQDDDTRKVVTHAIDELIQGQGAPVLFLPSIVAVTICDRVRGFETTLRRQPGREEAVIEGAGRVRTVRTEVITDGTAVGRDWRVISRMYGEPDCVSEEAAGIESKTLNAAAKDLPGKNWDKVVASPVDVAIPLDSEENDSQSVLLGANGRICIGLPTKDATGTPAWVNAHFSGTISRKGTELDKEYNKLLFQEAVRLHDALVASLRQSAEQHRRRVATLAYERDRGPLADAIFSVDISDCNLILGVDGNEYVAPGNVTLLSETESTMLPELLANLGDAAAYGFCLVDAELQARARPVLDDLVSVGDGRTSNSSLYLSRLQSTNQSLIEHAALRRRADGPPFWERFLSWLLDQFEANELTEQVFLPVGSKGVAKPSSRVFLPPTGSSAKGQGETDDEDEVGDIPDNLEDALNILDSSALSVRKGSTRNLTELASRLEDASWVRTPRLDILINDAIGPLMQSLTETDDDLRVGCSLLVQAVQWIWRLTDEGRSRLRANALRVPVPSSESSWTWAAPSSVYFGKGWVDETTDVLLDKAYGVNPRKRLVPWTDFVTAAGIDGSDRDAWVGAMESLGVSDTPKIIRSGSRHQAAPLVCWSTTELQIVDGVPCPIKRADRFWRPYLEMARKRTSETQSGQRFDFRSVTWIDGLEREASREAVVELILSNPAKYEGEITTFSERYQRRNQDRKPVKSLWVHAIVANQWPVIPTQNGRVSPRSAWMLDDDQRKLARQRLRLLNQVSDEYAEGKSLLSALGITSVANASVGRLLAALDTLAQSLDDLNADDRHNANSLAEDLFRYLQLAYGDSPASLDKLANVTLPLFKRQAVVAVAGASVKAAYFNDDPTRAAFVPDFAESLVWPLQSRYAYRDLVTEIRRQLGEDAVLFTSRVPIDSGFAPSELQPTILLLDWLTETWPSRNVISDLACLIAYSGRETNPSGDEFRRTWNRFKKAQLCRGRFPEDAPKPYFYDQQASQLQVNDGLSEFDIVEATWMLVDQSYRDTWAAYARDLSGDRVNQFMAERSITTTHRENVETEIGLTSGDRFRHMKSAFYSVWCKTYGDQPLELFESEWKKNAGAVKRMCDWVRSPALEEIVANALMQSEEDASVGILECAGVTIEQWQTDRERLSLEKLAFSDTARSWKTTLRQLVGVLRVIAARSSRVTLADAQSLIEGLAQSEVPIECRYLPLKSVDIEKQAIQMGRQYLEQKDDTPARQVLAERLATIEKNASTLAALSDAPRRDVAAYVDDPEPKRSRDAKARLEDFSHLCTVLAPHFGEAFDANVLSADNRVESLASGWWANCYTIVQAIQNVLQKNIPVTTKRMSDARVFRDLAPRNVLLARFEELKDEPQPPKDKPERKVELFGSEQGEGKFAEDLARGSAGEIGKRLSEAMKGQIPKPLTGDRAKAHVPASGSGGGGGGGGGGTSDGDENRQQRRITGWIGEACFYEWGLLHLPDFDERAWRSECREQYGLTGAGLEGLGFDFSYRDENGVLTGRSDKPLCKIEVKSSSGDGSEPFPITANEWDVARESHSKDDEVYVIVRIANVRTAPEITDVICDPFDLYRKGQIAFATKDMRMVVGKKPS